MFNGVDVLAVLDTWLQTAEKPKALTRLSATEKERGAVPPGAALRQLQAKAGRYGWGRFQ